MEKKIATDIIILHMCTKNHNYMMYGSWETEWDRQNLLSFWAIFCSFSPLYDPKNQNLETMKNIFGEIILSHMCTKNERHMIYCSWNIRRNRRPFLAFWAIFCSFTPLTVWKIKILKNWKIYLEILSYYTCAP